jgi:hypothetical protein
MIKSREWMSGRVALIRQLGEIMVKTEEERPRFVVNILFQVLLFG